jgi:predicted transcriptional regulator
MSDRDDKDLSLNLVSEIVSAYVSNNSVPTNQLSELITSVHQTLMNVGEKPPETLKPAVPKKRSVTPDFIVCLEDGKKLKMLKRHIRTSYNLSPKEYRQKWGLPDDYPMVAPKYAAQRSELAKKFGLGNAAKRRRSGRKKAA